MPPTNKLCASPCSHASKSWTDLFLWTPVQFTVCFVLTILQQSEVCLLVVVGGLINMDVTFRNHKTNAAQRTQSSSVTIITTLFSWSFRRALFPLNQTLHTALFYLTHPRSPTLVCLSMGSVGQHNGLAMPQRSFLTELTSYCTWWPQFTVLQGLWLPSNEIRP